MGWIDISVVLGTIFVILYSITVIGLALLIILENRNPLKTIPWIIVLIFIPGIGLVFYYFLGREDRRRRIISRRVYKRFHKQARIGRWSKGFDEIPDTYIPLARLLNNSAYSAIFGGSNIAVFTNGKDKFDALIADVKKARRHIHLQYYIFNDDQTGNRIKDALIEKAREGVKIRVLYDDVGCWHTKKSFFEEMKQAGIEVYPYLEVVFPLLTSKVNYRNHRKVTVIDGEAGYIGGMNIADRYVDGNRLGPWRDTHFRITGPGVYGLQTSFLLDWYTISNQLINDREYFPQLPSLSGTKIQVVMSGPTGQWLTLMQAFLFCISNAKQYIYIQTPYFLPTEALNHALQAAALSGIEVRLMIPERSDTLSAQMATFSYVGNMLRSGVKVYLYKEGFLHSKLLLTDGKLACIGSANFDFRSFEHNFEISAFVYQADFALQMKEMFMRDLRACEEIVYSQWRKRPLVKRLPESFMRLFAPLL